MEEKTYEYTFQHYHHVKLKQSPLEFEWNLEEWMGLMGLRQQMSIFPNIIRIIFINSNMIKNPHPILD